MLNKNFPLKDKNLLRKIALAGMYAKLNEIDHETIFGMSRLESVSVKKMYENLFGVEYRNGFKSFLTSKNHQPMVNLLEWFKNEGHRKAPRFDGFKNPKAILAWDVARYSSAARMGYFINYINLETTYEHLDEAYKMTKNNFDSWEDYGTNFMIFKTFWDNQNMLSIADFETKDTESLKKDLEAYYIKQGISRPTEMQQAIKELIKDKNSIWNKIEW